MIKPFPKLFVVPRIKPSRRLSRRHVTIVSGFLTNNAVVLAADSQELVSDFTKAFTQKIQIANYVGHWRLAMAGSSDHSQYIRLIESELSMRLTSLPKFDYPAIVSIIKATVHQVHKQHIWPRPSNRPEVQIIYAIQGLTTTPCRALLVSEDSAVTPVNDYMSVGIGTYLADYLKKRIYPNLGDVYNAPIELTCPRLSRTRSYDSFRFRVCG
jgi:hypothetical protein